MSDGDDSGTGIVFRCGPYSYYPNWEQVKSLVILLSDIKFSVSGQEKRRIVGI